MVSQRARPAVSLILCSFGTCQDSGAVPPEWGACTAAGMALEGSPTLLTSRGQHGTRQGAVCPHLRRWQDLRGPISDILWHQGTSREILQGTLFRNIHDIRVYIWPSVSVKFITTYSFNNSMAFAHSSHRFIWERVRWALSPGPWLSRLPVSSVKPRLTADMSAWQFNTRAM